MPAPPISVEQQQRIRETFTRLGSIQATALECGTTRMTVRKYLAEPAAPVADPTPAGDLPRAKHEGPPPPSLPDPAPREYAPFTIDTPGHWLILSDIHVPYHDRATLELAVSEAKRRGVVGVLLNGDTLDSHEISNHDKDPSAPRYVEEVETAKKLLAWLRGQLPGTRIVLKEGNHEERLGRYVLQRAPALFDLEGVSLPTLLHLEDFGAEWVNDKRVIHLGKLCVVHGHEYRGGGGVMPARWLYLRTRYVAMCGHFHRSSEYGDRDIRGKEERSWSVGCACHIHPRYAPLNSWNQGFAFVDVASDGNFSVDNRRVHNGKVV